MNDENHDDADALSFRMLSRYHIYAMNISFLREIPTEEGSRGYEVELLVRRAIQTASSLSTRYAYLCASATASAFSLGTMSNTRSDS